MSATNPAEVDARATCELCGYRSRARECERCAGASREPTLQRRRPAWQAALSALPQGLYFLATTRGTKRWLIPPVLISTAIFGLLLVWVLRWFDTLVAAVRERTGAALELEPGWWKDCVDWILASGVLVWTVQIGGGLLVVFAFLVAAFYAFSVVHEALSGPFLDRVHERIEERWFGSPPVPPASTDPRAIKALLLAAAIALAGMVGVWASGVERRWSWTAAAALGPFALGALASSPLRALCAHELRSLWTSLLASVFALTLMLLCLPLKFIPFVGWLLFGVVAGFATSISLFDIPFSRRRWSLAQRLRFLARHAPAIALFGLFAGALFIVPLFGPILLVPVTSVGGLWLFVQLDKNPPAPPLSRPGQP